MLGVSIFHSRVGSVTFAYTLSQMSESPNNQASAESNAKPPELRRLGRNINGYFGESIDIDTVLGDCLAAAHRNGWIVEEIANNPKLSLAAFKRSSQLVAQTRASTQARLRVYISTGIHGDEPAGPLAVRQLLQENRWPSDMDLWLVPCLNPAGFRLNRRENAQGIDLNREYLEPKAEETLAHIAWLQRQPKFDLCLCLHEDWESLGFYVYELNPDNRPSLAESIVTAAAQVCPIDPSNSIEGRPAHGGIIRPSIDPRDRPQWPEAFFLLAHKTRLSYTLEAPSDFPLSSRVSALAAAVGQALTTFNERHQPKVALQHPTA